MKTKFKMLRKIRSLQLKTKHPKRNRRRKILRRNSKLQKMKLNPKPKLMPRDRL